MYDIYGQKHEHRAESPVSRKFQTAKNVSRCWNEASLCISTTTALQICRIGVLLTMDLTLHYKMIGVESSQRQKCNIERNRHLSELVMLVETGAKLS